MNLSAVQRVLEYSMKAVARGGLWEDYLVAIRFPDLSGPSSCKLLSACGKLVMKDKDFLEWMEGTKLMVVRVRATKGATSFVRLILGGPFPEHFHIEVATEDYFENNAPKPTAKLAEVQKAFERLIGLKTNVLYTSRFWLPVSDLPPIIRSTLIQSVEDDVAIKMVGGKLAVTGAPIHAIEWGIREKAGGAFIDLDARKREVVITDSYLTDACSLLVSAFRVFVPIKDRHASPKTTRKKSD